MIVRRGFWFVPLAVLTGTLLAACGGDGKNKTKWLKDPYTGRLILVKEVKVERLETAEPVRLPLINGTNDAINAALILLAHNPVLKDEVQRKNPQSNVDNFVKAYWINDVPALEKYHRLAVDYIKRQGPASNVNVVMQALKLDFKGLEQQELTSVMTWKASGYKLFDVRGTTARGAISQVMPEWSKVKGFILHSQNRPVAHVLRDGAWFRVDDRGVEAIQPGDINRLQAILAGQDRGIALVMYE